MSKILYLHQYFNTPSMTGGTRSYEMARRLVQYGHEVHIITSYRQSDGIKKAWFVTDEDGIQVHWLSIPYSNKMGYGERIQAFLRFAWNATIKASLLKADLVFATSTPLTIALPAVYASKRQKIPMVFEVRDLWPELPIAVGALKNPILIKAAKWLEHFAYNNSKRIIALSPGMKDGIVKTGYPADMVEVIPNSCDLELFDVDSDLGKQLRQKNEWLEDRPLVIYTGTIGIINGVDYLARLACAVREIDKDIRFLVIGEGKGEYKLKEEAERLGVLNKNFFIMPSKPKQEIPGWLSAADMATSLFLDIEAMWSNSANKFFDALAAGKPIAINYQGWQADLINEAGVGLVLNPNDVYVSAKELVEKINDRNWLISAGSAAKQLAIERFDRNTLAKELEAFLIKAIKDS